MVLSITATKNRHSCLERVIGMLLNQDYSGEYTILIYNNSPDPQELDLPILPDNRRVVYYHRWTDFSGKPYETLGGIYNDILSWIERDTQGRLATYPPPTIITHSDDDDMFLPNHISEGVKGFNRAKVQGLLAYKPEKSWYRHSEGITLLSNTLEPSMFVDYNYLREKRYYNTTSDQHMSWVKDLPIYIDPLGAPTLVYNWGHDYPTFKTSGDPMNLLNFYNYEKFSKDKGDGIITPICKEALEEYYKMIENAKL